MQSSWSWLDFTDLFQLFSWFYRRKYIAGCHRGLGRGQGGKSMLRRAESAESFAGAAVARATSQVGQASIVAVRKRMVGLPTYALSTSLLKRWR